MGVGVRGSAVSRHMHSNHWTLRHTVVILWCAIAKTKQKNWWSSYVRKVWRNEMVLLASSKLFPWDSRWVKPLLANVRIGCPSCSAPSDKLENSTNIRTVFYRAKGHFTQDFCTTYSELMDELINRSARGHYNDEKIWNVTTGRCFYCVTNNNMYIEG